MQIMTRIAFLIAAVSVTLCFDALPSQAATYGGAPWCAVRDLGNGDMQWDCQYASAAECAPSVTGGNRGFCNVNPYFTGSYPPVAPWHRPVHVRRRLHRHHVHPAQ
jgi:hypothetical protein